MVKNKKTSYVKGSAGTAVGQALRKTGKKWLDKIQAAGKAEKHWLDCAAIAVKAYTSEGNLVDTDEATGAAYDFNILYANVETIVPAVINSAPMPDIRRRFGADDPVARDFAQIIERSIRIQVDDSKLQVEMEAMAQDAFLAGRGVIRLRFMSDIVGGETTDDELRDLAEADGVVDGTEDDEQDDASADAAATPASPERSENERLRFEAVSWKDYRHGPSKRWDDRPWDAFRHSIACDDYEDFIDGDLVASQQADGDTDQEADTDYDVWEVWDKKSRTVLFVSVRDGKVLKKVPDPLGLSNFFPIATPVQPIEVNGRLMPVNPFSIYRRLADELDTTTKRIQIITKQLKVKGWYAISPADIQNVLDADDNEFVPIADAEIWAAKGGLQNAVLFWPVEKLIVVLSQLYGVRDQSKQAIYEITGISDIVRGASKATETLGAQQLKSQWGSLRIQKMQRNIERAARDLFVMMSEIIPAKFSPETLQKMTDIQILPTQQDLTPVPVPPPPPPPAPGQPPMAPEQMQQLQQQAMQAQEAEKARQAKLQHLNQLQALMQDHANAYFRIDVESDSTIQADLTRQKAEATGFMQAASQYFQAVGPLVQQGALPMELAMEIFGSFSRLFNLGKSVEDVVDELVQMAKAKGKQPAGPKLDPKAEAAAADQKRKVEDAQVDRDIKTQDAETDRNIKQQNAALDQQIKGTELQIKQAQLAMVQRQTAAQQFGMTGAI
ncbi:MULTISPECIES: hypothetical protein [unclassified Mesorhizobium]|uniref:hypothetical protein n=1 Tax=unclassified Mesorhizobium TaxID=325217 RepID=UPI00112B6F03|nr:MULTISPECIES: hypothetical protein [unclassified Mesorhizobium]MCA0000952.1 hypothetical protein [Mesorhizobium sp. B264B2A]MCA0004701.1 hypothetical protein [Mesorhizobium sp. B264B1B]MCA0019100.1 hypothetical protein [Mesorhizobium sp. B264B1A]TPJ38181.1 hypothetical protein FJ437_30865 [Mesorhizobium sp. B2-6-6]